MKNAIKLTKSEIAWHKKHFKEGPSIEYEVAFIAGLEHLLELFTRCQDASQQPDPADPKTCGTCNGSGHIPCPDGFAICRECSGG